ncbi:c-type cytochrome [Candidatus Rariloculus sp.]|uniref:c-type cytochrome n=1 Tax=Candidatus Rariloculus sp. TaxID=3101265 RepID=UPI003D0FF7BC
MTDLGTISSRLSHPRLVLPAAALMVALTAPGGAEAQDNVGRYEQTDIEYGATLYNMHCIACHGENGDLLPEINLRTGRFPNSPSDRDLGDNIRNGLPDTAMIATEYTDSEVTALVAYVRNIGSVDLDSILIGDPIRGQGIFEGTGECASCHRVFGRGPRAAPDLSNIGAIRTASQLERSLLGTAGATIPINRAVRVVTADGTAINGRRLNEDTFTVQLVDENERLVSLEKATLNEYTILETSAMPAYAETLSDDERADVLAYLLSLKGMN